MTPNQISFNHRNECEVDTVDLGDRLLSFTSSKAAQDVLHRRLCEFRHTMLTALDGRSTTLGFSVLRVVCWGTDKEMRGVDTRRIVAMVTNIQTLPNRPIAQHPSNAVCFQDFGPHTKCPVARSVTARSPNPTRPRTTGSIYFLPKRRDLFRGKLRLHRVLLTLGATPRLFAQRGAFICIQRILPFSAR